MYGRPGRGGVAALEKLAVGILVAGAAVARCHLSADDESMVIDGFLPLGGLVAIEAGYAVLCVVGHFILMHDGVLRARMALRAFARGLYQSGRWLFHLNLWASTIDKESCNDEPEGNYYGKEHGAERHQSALPWQGLWLGAEKGAMIFQRKTTREIYQVVGQTARISMIRAVTKGRSDQSHFATDCDGVDEIFAVGSGMDSGWRSLDIRVARAGVERSQARAGVVLRMLRHWRK